MSEYKIGVDIGGTFTDVVLWDVAGNQTHNAKLLTTPDDPSRAVQEGVRRILDENGVPPESVVAVILLSVCSVMSEPCSRNRAWTPAGAESWCSNDV